MALEVFKLFGTIAVDTAKVNQAINDAVAKAEQAKDKMSSSFEKITAAGEAMSTIGKGLTLGVTAPISTAVGAIMTFGIKTAETFETTAVAFNTMLGSADAGQAMYSKLKDFAAQTPFELNGVTDAAKKLLAFGWQANDIIPTLNAVGGAASGLGLGTEGLNRIIVAMGQIKAKGKLQADEMLQLTEAGVPAWKYLAQAIGTDTATAMQKVTDGAIDADTAISALTSGMQSQYGDMLQAQSTTLAGLISNMKDVMTIKFGESFQKNLDPIKQAVAGITAELGPFIDAIMPAFVSIMDRVPAAMNAVITVMDKFAQAPPGVQKGILALAAGLVALGPVLTVAGKGMSVFGTVMPKVEKLLEAGGKKWTAYKDSIKENVGMGRLYLEEAAKGFGSTFASIGQAFAAGASPVTSKVKDMAETVALKAMYMGDTVKAKVSDMASTIALKAMEMGDGFKAKVSDMVETGVLKFLDLKDRALAPIQALASTIGQKFGELKDKAMAPIKALGDALSPIKDKVKDVAETVALKFMEMGDKTKGKITEAFSGIAERMSGPLKEAASKASESFGNLGRGIGTMGKGIGLATVGIGAASLGILGLAAAASAGGVDIAAMGQQAVTTVSNIAANLPSVVNQLVSTAQTVLPQIIAMLPQLGQALGQAFTTIMSALPQLLPQLLSAIQSLITSLISVLPQFLPMIITGGLQLLMGIVQAITQILPIIAAAIPGIVMVVVQLLPVLIPMLLQAAVQLFMALVQALPQIVTALVAAIPLVIGAVVQLLPTLIPLLLQAAITLFMALVDSLPQIIAALATAIPQVIDAVIQLLITLTPLLLQAAVVLFMALVHAVPQILGQLKSAFGDLIGQAVDHIRDKFNSGLATVKGAVQGKFDEIRNAIGDKINAAKDAVGNAINAIKGFFNFSWSLPSIKLPHFKISGSFSLNPPSIPKLGVDWYAKGGILTEPTVFGMSPDGKAQVGGEAGAEAVAPIETLMAYIRTAVAEQNGALADKMDEAVALLAQYLPQMASMQLVTDTGALVGAIAPQMDTKLGEIKKTKERGR